MTTYDRDRLPEKWVNERMEKANTMTFFGKQVNKLNREELMACLVEMHGAYRTSLEQNKRERSMYRAFNEAKK